MRQIIPIRRNHIPDNNEKLADAGEQYLQTESGKADRQEDGKYHQQQNKRRALALLKNNLSIRQHNFSRRENSIIHE